MTQATYELEGSWFSRFMASGWGRLIRIGIGVAIILTGLLAVGGTAGLAIAALSVLPITTGAFNLCPVAPAWGGHFIGAKYCGTRKPR